jgi:hypothetical protein
MKDAKEPLLILLILFVIIGLVYSPFKASLNKSSSGNVTKTPSTIGAIDNNLGSSANKEVAGEIKSTAKDIKTLQDNLNKQIAKEARSPYYGKINLTGISGLHGSDPDREYMTISTNLKKNETVKITGWYLKSEITGYYVVIGKAALLPFPFTNTESDIVLQQGDRAYLTKGFSPIGISFRTNKCSGYFEENRTFTPSLSLQCPLAKNEILPNFSSDYDSNDACLKIIERIPRCSTIDSEFIRKLPDTTTLSCKNYMADQINYNTCIAIHFSDIDFPGSEYRVYLNKFGPLWRTTHDTVDLRDENGLIVGTIKY